MLFRNARVGDWLESEALTRVHLANSYAIDSQASFDLLPMFMHT